METSKTVPAGLQALEIERACQRLNQLFALHVDMHQFDRLGELFTEDGALRRANGDVVVGPQAIAASFADRDAGFHSVHMLSPVLVEIVSADSATGRCTMIACVHDTGRDVRRQVAGFYEDRYRCEDGRWKFARRFSTIVIPAA